MIIAERQTRLKALLAQRGMSDLDSLSSELQVSQSTVRRDIEHLEQGGLVQRTHGGVIWIAEKQNGGGNRPYAFDQRMNYRADAKRQIAAAASRLIEPERTVILDGGTTTFYLARELLGRPMQIVTNSLPIANLFLNDEHVELVLSGGQMYPRYGVLLGPVVESFFAGIHASTLFLSAAGIHAGRAYNQNLMLVQAEKRMIERVQRVVLLADSGKFGQQALANMCSLEDVDLVVTDSEITDEHRRMVEQAGCELIVGEPPGTAGN